MLISSGDRTRCYPDISLKHGIGGAAFKHAFPDANLRVQLNEGWNIYPNPTDGIAFEYLKSDINVLYQYKIYDVTGRCVVTEVSKTSNRKHLIPLNALQAGVYFLKAQLENGKVYTTKLILK